VLTVDDTEVDVDNRQVRFTIYSVNSEALKVVSISLMFVWTTHTSDDRSTATHVDISKQSFKQPNRDVYG